MVLVVRNDGIGLCPVILERAPEILHVPGYDWRVAVIAYGAIPGDRQLAQRLGEHVEIDMLREYEMEGAAVWVSYCRE